MRTQALLVPGLAAFVLAQTPPGFTPSTDTLLPASYGALEISPGVKISQNATTSAPIIQLPNNNSLVILIDLDTPYADQNRTFAPFLHWIGTPSSNASAVPYMSPNPPAGSPDHRYVVLAYDLPAKDSGLFNMPTGFEHVGAATDLTGMTRATFDLEGFVKAAELTGLEAANWFTMSPATQTIDNGTTPTATPEPFQGGAGKLNVGMAMALVAAAGMSMSVF